LTNALPRGLATLRAFVLDQKLLGNVEIAKVTGLPKPTVSCLTFTLASGFCRVDGQATCSSMLSTLTEKV